MTLHPLREADEPCPECVEGWVTCGCGDEVPCPACHGDGTQGEECPGCQGHGKGSLAAITQCACRGTGRIPGTECPECGGTGVKDGRRKLQEATTIGGQACPACAGDGTKGEACSGDTRGGWPHPNDCAGGCNGTGRIPGDPDAPKVIAVKQVGAAAYLWRDTRSHGNPWVHSFAAPEAALRNARETLGERDD